MGREAIAKARQRDAPRRAALGSVRAPLSCSTVLRLIQLPNSTRRHRGKLRRARAREIQTTEDACAEFAMPLAVVATAPTEFADATNSYAYQAAQASPVGGRRLPQRLG